MRLKAIALLLFSSLAGPVFAQSAAGVAGLSGIVRDPSGSAVPGAKVVISSASQGTIRTLTTNEAGVYTAPGLTPGPGYQVSVSASGFSDYQAKNITLLVGQVVDLHVVLQVGTTMTSVEVSGAATLVEDTKTDTSAVVNNTSIMNLPINGRRVDNFVLLTPGVSRDGNYGLLTFRGVAGQNAFLVDGADTTDSFYNENAGRTRIAAQISQDAVQEFQVVTSNYSAEYGRAMGGVVNTVTKSGGNDFHGGAFWFYRSTGFNARDPFSIFVPSEKRNQSGGTLGGPIKKDKLFFFLSTEISRRNFPLVSSLSSVAVNGATHQWVGCGVASAGLPAATPAQCAAINTLLPRFYTSLPRTLNQELYLGKIDYHISDRNSLSASFNFLHSISPNGIQTGTVVTTGGAITGNGNDYVTVRNGHVGWTWVPTSSFVNEARFAMASDRQADDFNNDELGGGLGYLQVSANGTQMGPANYLPRIEPMETRFQWQDNATWTKGTHTVKFGTDIATTQDYVYYISNYYGSYTYQTVNAFALDYSGNTTGAKNWQSYSQTFGKGDVTFRQQDYGFYLQDQWRVSKRLNFQYGARYEYAQLPQPSVCNHNYPATCHLPSSPTNLAPRLGLTYRINDKTVIQAGYGMFFARFQGGTIDNLFTTGNGLYTTSISLRSTSAPQVAAGPLFPNTLTSIPSVATAGSTALQFLDQNLKTPYSEQGNIGIQRQLTSDIAMSVSYLWSRGVQLYGIRDLNLPSTTTNFTYTINDTSGKPAGSWTTPVVVGNRPDPRYNGIYLDDNGVNGYYNGMAVQVNKTFKRGLQAQASYTWSHEIDDGQSYGESTNNLFLSNANAFLANGNYKLDKGNGTLDQRHRFALSWVWAPTFSHRTDFLSRFLVNNWQLSTITSLESGFPYGNFSVKVNDTPVTSMFSNFSLNGTGFSGRVPWLPVNGYMLPPMYRTDARLSKILPFGAEERYKVTLLFEMFNISNSIAPRGFNSSQAFTEAKGVITPTPASLYIPSGDAIPPDGTEARRMQIGIRFTF